MFGFTQKVTGNRLYQWLILGLFVVCFLLLLVGISFAQARHTIRDRIYLRNQKDPEVGEITKENFEKVELRISGGTKEFLLEDIKSIRYDREPTKYLTARKAMNRGEYVQAIESYRKLLKENVRKIFKQHIMFHLALCLQKSNQCDEAIQVYDDLLKEIPDTRYFRKAQLNKANCYLKKQMPEAGITSVDKGIQQAYQIKIKEEFIHRLNLLKGRFLENSDFSKALVHYKQLEMDALHYQEIVDNALAGRGRCYLQDNRFKQAESAFKTVAGRSKDRIALGSAYAGLGDCYFEQAKQAKTSVSRYKKTIMEGYLWTWVLYRPPEGESMDDYARSGYWAAYCFEMMGNLFEEEKLRERYREYARKTYERVRDQFPGTTWNKKSQERLSQMK